jgi:uncharacterized protein YndB with AHSA1/START domain
MNEQLLSVRRTIVVNAAQDRCFDTFIDMTAWWPLATHTIGEAPARASIVQTRADGRWYDIDKNGDEHEIGRVLAYEPPDRIVLAWEISCAWQHDVSSRTEIEIRFIPETPERTRVELEHRGFEVFGERAAEQHDVYDADGAWTSVMDCYAAVAAPSSAFAALAFHHYADDHHDAFRGFCERVLANVAGTPGLLRFELLHDAAGRRLIGTSLWESRDAFQSALPAILAFGAERQAEWSTQDDERVFGERIASWTRPLARAPISRKVNISG